MENYYPNRQENLKAYKILKSKYEELEKQEDKLSNEISELKAKRYALCVEKDYIASRSNDIFKKIEKELVSEIEKIEKEIDLKQILLQDISMRVEIYYKGLKQEVERNLI